MGANHSGQTKALPCGKKQVSVGEVHRGWEENMKTPEWHEEILEERREKIEDGTAKFISLTELKARRNNESQPKN